MSKCDDLGRFLAGRDAMETPMTFEEVEAVIGFRLPAAAGRYAAWWSNNPSNNVMTKVWLEAGYRTERVDLGGRRVVFRRAHPPTSPAAGASAVPGRSNVLESLRHRLGSSVRMQPGGDPTAPTANRGTPRGDGRDHICPTRSHHSKARHPGRPLRRPPVPGFVLAALAAGD